MSNEQLLEKTNIEKYSPLFDSILPIEPKKDAKKSELQISADIFKHTETKMEVNRNMLATLYVKDPNQFNKTSDEQKKICLNNISWPRNYQPTSQILKKAPP